MIEDANSALALLKAFFLDVAWSWLSPKPLALKTFFDDWYLLPDQGTFTVVSKVPHEATNKKAVNPITFINNFIFSFLINNFNYSILEQYVAKSK